MDNSELFERLSDDLSIRLNLLEDKPEETVETTLKALWLTAAGNPVSAEGALNQTLPELTDKQKEELDKMIALRLSNIPLAHITRRQGFMGIELLADKRALIPRKETELLGKKALELSKIIESSGKITVIDACCGSGNLGIAVAHYNQNCKVYATDISQEAVDLTIENVRLLNLANRIHVTQGDLLSAFDKEEFYEKINLIICNPPYIQSSKLPKMNSEIISNEPALAFDGGMLGIKIIQKLIAEAPRYLVDGGWLVFEVGAGQGEFIAQLAGRSDSYGLIESVSDESGIPRVIVAQKGKRK
jgi:release factor glutamine methyltransferase